MSMQPLSAGQRCPRVPLFLAHGIADSCVPYQQSVRVFNALKAHGIPTDLVLVPGAEHADPSCFSPRITAQFFGFLQQHMPTDSTEMSHGVSVSRLNRVK